MRRNAISVYFCVICLTLTLALSSNYAGAPRSKYRTCITIESQLVSNSSKRLRTYRVTYVKIWLKCSSIAEFESQHRRIPPFVAGRHEFPAAAVRPSVLACPSAPPATRSARSRQDQQTGN